MSIPECVIERAKAGDKAAAAHIVDVLLPHVRCLIRKVTNRSAVDEDLMQEGIMSLLRALRTYRGDNGAKFETVAFTAIFRGVLRSRKREEAFRMMHVHLDGADYEEIKVESAPESRWAPVPLDCLSMAQRRVVNLYFGLNGEVSHTHDEIGAMLGVSRARITQIIATALRMLRLHMKEGERA